MSILKKWKAKAVESVEEALEAVKGDVVGQCPNCKSEREKIRQSSAPGSDCYFHDTVEVQMTCSYCSHTWVQVFNYGGNK